MSMPMRQALVLVRKAILIWFLLLLGLGQEAESQGEEPDPADALPAPRALPGQAPTFAGLWGSLGNEPIVLPIDLQSALCLAQTANLEIAQAREFVNVVQAAQLRADVLVLPNLTLGTNYVHHEGQIQRTEGNIVTVNRDSLWMGGGPQMTWNSAEALFAPLVARQVTQASIAGVVRVTNDTLLQVADAYFNILRARRRLARTEEVLDYLTDPRPAASRGNAKGLLPLIRDVVEVGGKDAFRSDLERVRVEVFRRQDERRGAIQDLEVATAELARLLHIDARTPLWPVEDYRTPLPLPGEPWYHQPIDVLVAAALNNRPELAENRALVQAAAERVRLAKWRPLLPSFAGNFGYGDFGGGPNANQVVKIDPKTGEGKVTTVPGFGPSGRILHFKNRSDFDAAIFWQLKNLGLGNKADVRENQALVNQANIRQLQIHDRVVAQVVQTREQLDGWWDRLQIARTSLLDGSGEPQGPAYLSIRLNFERIRGGEGRPLEVQDSIRGLADMLDLYYQAVTDYERSRFRLLIALGMPPESILEPDLLPLPPPLPESACGPEPAGALQP